MESKPDHEDSSQTETPDVLIQYRDALVKIDLNWKEWLVFGFIAAAILFALDMLGYW